MLKNDFYRSGYSPSIDINVNVVLNVSLTVVFNFVQLLEVCVGSGRHSADLTRLASSNKTVKYME